MSAGRRGDATAPTGRAPAAVRPGRAGGAPAGPRLKLVSPRLRRRGRGARSFPAGAPTLRPRLDHAPAAVGTSRPPPRDPSPEAGAGAGAGSRRPGARSRERGGQEVEAGAFGGIVPARWAPVDGVRKAPASASPSRAPAERGQRGCKPRRSWASIVQVDLEGSLCSHGQFKWVLQVSSSRHRVILGK